MAFSGTKVNDLEISGSLSGPTDINLTGTCNISGATRLGSTLAATGNTTIGGTLAATGNTTIGGTLQATGNTTVGGTFTATGNVTLTAGGTGGVSGVPYGPLMIGQNYAMTSVQASAGTVGKITLMRNVTIKDWNIEILNGATCTGATSYKVVLNASLAGTGAAVPLGTATLAGTTADQAIIDAAVVTDATATRAAGDDLYVTTVAGTALPAGDVHFQVWVDAMQALV